MRSLLKSEILRLGALLLLPWSTAVAADIELAATNQLPECHSIGWVRRHTLVKDQRVWDGKLDEVKWGTPSPAQVVARNWSWSLTEAQWRQAVKEQGEGKREETRFDLWLPEEVRVARGVVAISGHGSGETLFRHPELRKLARELGLALFKFVGNPMQRGFWPQSLLYQKLQDFGARCGHPELEHAPLFLYGHSNGTGFSAIFPAAESGRVWAWVSMRPGTTFQVYQPDAARVPGMVIFGEDDPFLARPSREENLAVVPLMRRKHHALWNYAVEPKTGHGPGGNTWPLVFSFLRETFHLRVPKNAVALHGPVALAALKESDGCIGTNWDAKQGGYQNLMIAPYDRYDADGRNIGSWLITRAFASDWQTFQREGKLPASR